MSLIVETKFVELFSERPLLLESGDELKNINVAYQTYGKLNSDRNNVIFVFHALTGNAHAAGLLKQIEFSPNSKPDYLEKYSKMNLNKTGWWDGIIGPAKGIDTNKYFVICANILGSCYGTTGPNTKKNVDGNVWGKDFPIVTVRDMVKVQKELLDFLKIEKIKACIGGSLGGFQVFEFGIMYPEISEILFPIACDVVNTDWAIAFNEIQRKIITSDINWNNGNISDTTINNLAIARMVGLLSYRTPENYNQKFNRKIIGNDLYDKNTIFDISNYFNYQGKKFVNRFDPISYLRILQATDLHDISYKRGSFNDVLAEIKSLTISIVIDSDILYLPERQEYFTNMIPKNKTHKIHSTYGHDGFLTEFEQLNQILKLYI
jgi:homoserine O-acetyltransferase